MMTYRIHLTRFLAALLLCLLLAAATHARQKMVSALDRLMQAPRSL